MYDEDAVTVWIRIVNCPSHPSRRGGSYLCVGKRLMGCDKGNDCMCFTRNTFWRCTFTTRTALIMIAQKAPFEVKTECG